VHELLEHLWRSPTIRAMDHDGRVQQALRAARAAEYVPVMLESPFAGADPRYVHACIRDCIARGEAPIASHVLYTQALDDTVPEERAAGIAAGFALRWLTARTVVYTDLGISAGMHAGIEHARGIGHAIELRDGVKP
jgi:hypothetical protein